MTIPLLGHIAANVPPTREMQKNLLIHQLFEKQVERTPEAVAVVCNEQSLTYAELNRRANYLAHHLRTLGVGPEVLIGLCVDRSVELIVGLLGILKAGGVYVPLDPAYPSERFSFILADTQMPVLVTQTHLIEKLPGDHSCPIVLDMHKVVAAQSNDANPTLALEPDHLAYVIYTSGSTGLPKGVLVEHEAITAHCQAITQLYELSAADSVLQFSAFTFDASLEQILPALITGARLVIRGPEIWSPLELLHWIIAYRLTVMDLSPAYLRLALEEWAEAPEKLADHQLRLIIVGGDRFSPEILAWWSRVPLRDVRLLNAYGPTETTITATLLEVAPADEQHSQTISIGSPLPERTVYILDEAGDPVSVGTAGEMYIGGSFLARGYLRRPDLTAERFLPDPFRQSPGARLYKTGDRARYLSNGTIEFLGRVDHQVKIRGFRVELGEVETILGQHPAVRQVAVVAREERPGAMTLTAYLAPQKGQTLLVEELKELVLQQLPDYMLPSAFLCLESLPLTASGKVDRRALPVPESRKRRAAGPFIAPTIPLHSQLARIWEELLDVHPIGLTDDFFDLGGHSLLAARLFDRIEQVCGKRLPISTLHGGTTIQYLATVLTQDAEVGFREATLSINTDGNRRPFFYLHGQVQGNSTLHCYPLARALGKDQPFYGLKTYPLSYFQESLPTLQEIAAAQLKTIRALQPEGPYLLGGCCNGGLVAYEMARQLEAAGQTVALLFLLDPAFLVYPLSLKAYHAVFQLIKRLLRLKDTQQLDWSLRLKHLVRTLFFTLLRKKDPDPVTLDNLSYDYFRVYDWIVLRYQPSTRYSGKITFLWAKEGKEVKGYRKGWQRVETTGLAEIHLLSGDHITCRTEYLSELTECLATCIHAAQEANDTY